MSTTNQIDPARANRLAERQDRLHKELAVAMEAFDQLRALVDPVLQPSQPHPPLDPGATPDSPPASELGAFLEGITSEIRSFATRIFQVAERVDL